MASKVDEQTTKNPVSMVKSFFAHKMVHDLIAGTGAGICTVLVGHSFETAKTRIQMTGGNLFTNFRSIIQNEGLLSLYKGVMSPLTMMPFLFATQFTAYGFAKRYLGIDGAPKWDSKSILAGSFTGLCCSIVLTPIDIIKMKLQMEGIGVKTKPTGTYTMLRNTVVNDGFLALYKGLPATMMRDIPSRTLTFSLYEYNRRFLVDHLGSQSLANLFAGGMSSFMSWFIVYPLDIVKTKVQCSPSGGISYWFKQIYREHGLKGFYKGVEAPLSRSIITGSVTFFTMESIKSFLLDL